MRRHPCQLFLTEKGWFVANVVDRALINLTFPISEEIAQEITQLMAEHYQVQAEIRKAGKRKHTLVQLRLLGHHPLAIMLMMDDEDAATMRYVLNLETLTNSRTWSLCAVEEVDVYQRRV